MRAWAVTRELLIGALQGRGTVADRILADLDTVENFYFGPMSQVQASSWSKGRFVLLGDAAYCPTPFTGRGTALSLVGAYILAGEINRNATCTEAFDAYDRQLRPYVQNAQKMLGPALIRLMHPKAPLAVSLTHLVQRMIASRAVQMLFKPSAAKRGRNIEHDFDLPSYG